MIIIDGQQSDVRISNFDNLEDILVKIMEDGGIENRVVTDVLVNNENFSEIYPHQAEDMETEPMMELMQKAIAFYRENAKKKERTARFADRLGIDEIKKGIGL